MLSVNLFHEPSGFCIPLSIKPKLDVALAAEPKRNVLTKQELKGVTVRREIIA
jgi:hypothetical protein